MKRAVAGLSVLIAVSACSSPRPGSVQEDAPPEDGLSIPADVVPVESADSDVATMTLLPAPAQPVIVPIRRRPEAPGGPVMFDGAAPAFDPQIPSPAPADNFQALPDNGIFIPPDTDGAVGPNHLMVALNSEVRMQTRAGATLATVSLTSFWSTFTTTDVFDPKVQYDPTIGRWLIVTIADAELSTSAVLLGVSTTSDPTGSWHLYRIPTSSTGNWADYPSFGFDKDWIVVSCNVFNNAGTAYKGTKTFVASKAAAAAGTLTSLSAFTTAPTTGDFTIDPAITTDASVSTEWLLSDFDGPTAQLRLYSITGPVAAPVFTTVATITGASTWADGVASEMEPQAGSANRIDGGDSRIQDVVYSAGSLWSSHTIYVPAATPTRSAAQWWQINPVAQTILQNGRIDDPTGTFFYAYPTIAINANGDALIGLSHFSSSEFPSAGYAYRAFGDAANTFRDVTTFKTGLAPYFKDFGSGSNRWGDYSNTVVDPVNSADFWTIQEVSGLPSGGMSMWLTWWGHVLDPNHAPTLSTIANASALEDAGAQTVSLSGIGAGATTESAQTLTISATSSNPAVVPNPSIGAISAGGATLTWTPATDANGSATITVTLQDNGGTANGGADTITRTFTATVTAVNDPPTLAAIADQSVPANSGAHTVGLTGISAGPANESTQTVTLSATSSNTALVPNPTIGAVSAGSATLSYSVQPGQTGSATITVTAQDDGGTANGGSNSRVRTFQISVSNTAPAGVADAYATNEDVPLSVAAPGVLANDTDSDGDPLTAVLSAGPAHGTLTLNADGSFLYVPNANYNGSDAFSYTPNDGTANGNVTTVSITINPVNDAPVSVADSYSVNEDVTLTAGAPGVLANDSDADGDPMTALLGTGPAHGTLTLSADGSFQYVPNANFNGSDSFTYRANDGAASGNLATVSITVNPVNDAPAGVNDSYSVNENSGTTTFAAPGPLANDTDADGDTLSMQVQSSTTHGTLTFNANGQFSYTPNAGYFGSDAFTYEPFDGTVLGSLATVAIDVVRVNTPPVSVADSYTTNEDTMLSVAAPGVLSNDSDADADALTAAVVSGTAHGTLALAANGSFTYLPDANFNGMDSFDYRANDGTANGNTVTVTIMVTAVNDPPVAVADSGTTAEDTPLSAAAPGVLANDTDVDSMTLTAVLVSGPAHGMVMLNANGSWTYTPDPDFNGSDSFSYAANDGMANGNTTTVSVTVTPVNDAPIAVLDSAGVMEDAALDVAAPGVLANDGDVDGPSLAAVLVTGPAHGTLTLSADGSYHYQPDADFNGDDSFTYHADDGAAASQDVLATIHVAPVNDFPTIPVPIGPVADTVFKTPDVSFSWNASTDVDGDAITYHFTVKRADGTTYQDTPTYNTTISFLGPNGFENGAYTWEVEALDASGATLGPIAPIAFTVSHHAGGSGCGCDTTGGAPSAGAVVPGLMLIAVLSRRILMAR